ncbi:hypothetical protein [Flammeovirga sp. EKP202]|uniref:hypothetical protein n=1 Tax=Flammeovirga sp. EKP202 TaxID=2770592 RepID=UPI00165ECC62|nr:hypothetical protein [Flammeovirga sp. EKP202]MBD0400822.1 hypothetical protein [Flammeovirga sp. EKP202]
MDPLYNLILTPIYLCIIYFLIAPFFEKRWTNKYTKKYFWLGLNAKIIGCIFFCLIYHFYYGGGDTTAYFNQGGIIVDAFLDSPTIAFETILYDGSTISGESAQYLSKLFLKKNPSTWLMVQISGIIQLFTLKSFYVTSLFFGLWSFLGTWKLVQLFTSIYKTNYKLICYAVLFIPSCLFWSSGIMKETITTGAIGFFVFYSSNILFKKKDTLLSFLVLITTFFLIKTIKGATIFVLFPCLLLWVFLYNYKRISTILKYSLSLLLLCSVPLVLFLMAPKIQEYIENNEEFVSAQKTIHGFQSDHGGEWRKGRGHGGGDTSAYHLTTAGDLSLLGMLKALPEAISYTLFRPFPWETKKVVQLLGSLESFAFILITIYIFFKVGVIKTMGQTFTDPHLGFVLSYALFFGFIAGYISFNYGVLQRFKTPMMPFYTLFLVIHYQYITKKTQKRKSRRKVIKS